MTKYFQSSIDCVIAFEVSKADLTVHFMPEDRQVAIINTEPAIRKVLRSISKTVSALIVCEASGGYERHVLECCAALNITAVMRKLIVILNAVLKSRQPARSSQSA